MGQALSSVAMGASSFISANNQAGAAEMSGAFTKQQSEFNAQMADLQAADAIRRGDKDATTLKKGAKQLIGSQRAGLAAQGIDVNSGSAADVQADTAGSAEVDALTIKNNAWREAFGYKVQALDARTKGNFAELAGRNEAKNTLLTGGITALGYGIKGGYEFASNYAESKKGAK